LPAAPSLEQLRKRAEDLVLERRADGMRLSEAQRVLAREYGFASWLRLKAYVDRVSTYGPGLAHAFVDEIEYYRDRAEGLRSVVASGLDSGIAIVRAHHPALAAASDTEIRALSPTDARLVLAREHGFPSWQQFRRHVRGLAESGEPFRRAFRALKADDRAALSALLDRYPGLVDARGTNGNDLLGLAAGLACGKRDHLLVRELLARGADPSAGNDRGWTPLHQAGYGNDVVLAGLLLDAGARTDVNAHGDGGTPLAAALFWGHRDVADFLAGRDVVPRNLRIAAGLGRPDLIQDLVRGDGSLSKAAGQGRGFYRPHTGFPIWEPSDDPREVLDEALVWAAKSDRVGVLEVLVGLGADVNGDPYRGTPLMWAAARGRVLSIRRLVELGADPSKQTSFGGQEHGKGVTALHLAAQSGHMHAVEALLAAGADPAVPDDLYHSPPAGWAEHGGHRAIAEALRARAN
jgi:ankyrin repeat protein